jgi:hypothetical protein
MKIREVMTEMVELVDPDTALHEAAQRMRDVGIGFLPVGVDDRLVGTLTDRDITVRAVADGLDPKVARVREAMSRSLVYCFEGPGHQRGRDADGREQGSPPAGVEQRQAPGRRGFHRRLGVQYR